MGKGNGNGKSEREVLIMESFIHTFRAEQIRQNEQIANEGLTKLQKLIESRGESLQECKEYAEKGAFWKVEQIMSECEDWLNKTQCPQYLRADAMQRAKESISQEVRDYYQNLAHHLNIRFGMMSSDPVISLLTDVEEKEGKWRVSKAFVEAQMEAARYYLSDREKSDVEAVVRLLKRAKAMERRGYNAVALMSDLWKASEQTIAQTIVGSYLPDKDTRGAEK